MPSEQGAPSKPAKERSNHLAAAVAAAATTGPPKASGARGLFPGKMALGGASGGAGRPASEAEKDSGFSDASSERLSAVDHTDTEDPLPPLLLLPPPPAESAEAPAKGPFPDLAPVYIVKNVVLKQPLGSSPGAPFLAWNGQHLIDASAGPAAHILLLQPPAPSLQPLASGPKAPPKEAYLPILSTYPRIAPHPGHGPAPKGASAPPDGAKKTKRFCLEEAQDAVTSSSSSIAGLDRAEGRMISRASRKLGPSGSRKQQRFHNTVEILRKSGLLGITLRTKELIRQNSATQKELAELREQAQLLCEAVQGNDAQAWARLQEAMDRSAAYWARKSTNAVAANRKQSKASEAQGSDPDADVASAPDSPMNLTLTPADTSAPLP